MRLFFSLPPDPAARSALAEIQRAWRRRDRMGQVRWLPEEAFHLTVAFLGEVDRADELAEATTLAFSPPPPAFSVPFSGAGWFPSERHPRVAAVELAEHPALAGMLNRLHDAIDAAGLVADRRPFRGHITIGRVRGRVRPRFPASESCPGAYAVTGLALMRSHLEPQGARHDPLATWDFAPTLSQNDSAPGQI